MSSAYKPGRLYVKDKGAFLAADPLQAAIKKWEFIRDNVDDIELCGGIETCRLCVVYYRRDGNGTPTEECCKGCPVYEHTGLKFCANTPFEEYLPCLDPLNKREVAEDEVNFLRSLQKR